MDPYERLVAINEALQEAMKPVTTVMAGKESSKTMSNMMKNIEKVNKRGSVTSQQAIDIMRPAADQTGKQVGDTTMMGAVKTMATGQDMTRRGQESPDAGRSAARVAATRVASRLQDTARGLKKRGGIIGGTKTGRRLAIVGQRVASRLGLTPKADAAAKKKALNRRINKKGEIRKGIDIDTPTAKNTEFIFGRDAKGRIADIDVEYPQGIRRANIF